MINQLKVNFIVFSILLKFLFYFIFDLKIRNNKNKKSNHIKDFLSKLFGLEIELDLALGLTCDLMAFSFNLSDLGWFKAVLVVFEPLYC